MIVGPAVYQRADILFYYLLYRSPWGSTSILLFMASKLSVWVDFRTAVYSSFGDRVLKSGISGVGDGVGVNRSGSGSENPSV